MCRKLYQLRIYITLQLHYLHCVSLCIFLENVMKNRLHLSVCKMVEAFNLKVTYLSFIQKKGRETFEVQIS